MLSTAFAVWCLTIFGQNTEKVLRAVSMSGLTGPSTAVLETYQRDFRVKQKLTVFRLCIMVLNVQVNSIRQYNFYLWITFYFQPLIIQLSPWKCVYPHTSGSRPNHFHNQLLVVEAFLITNIQKYVYFYHFNENVRYIFPLMFCILW